MSRRRPDRERGAVLVLTALLLVVLMGFAAIAVDAAAAWSEKREVQSGADMGALAAIQAIPRTLTAAAVAESGAQGAEFVTRNADASPSVSAPGPGGCEGRPSSWTRQCLTNVTVSAAGSSDNAFAPAIGAADSISVPASAEAQITVEYPAMKLFPIGVNGTGGQRLRCAAQGGPGPGPTPIPQCAIVPLPLPVPNPLPDPLPDPVPVGNNDVRLLGIRRFDLGCDADNTNVVATTNSNVINGVDHLVDEDLSAPAMAEVVACTDGHELSLPNMFQSGISPNVAADGIRTVIGGSQQLWDYLRPGNLNVLCQPITYTSIVHPDPAVLFAVKSFLLNACLNTNPANPFNLPSSSPRLGWAIDQSGNRVQGYVPIWIHSLVNGFLTPQTPNSTGFSVFVLNQSWLPAGLTEVDPGGMDNLTFSLVD